MGGGKKRNKQAAKGASKKRTKAKWIAIFSGIAVFVAFIDNVLGIGASITNFFRDFGQQDNTPPYYTGSEWMHMERTGAVLDGSSHIQLYADSINGSPYEDNNLYYNGAILIVLYGNNSENEKIITKFRVYADGIVEDLSPVLSAGLMNGSNDPETPVLCHVHNNGWSTSGKVQIDFSSIVPLEGYGNDPNVNIRLREGTCTSWELDSVAAGEVKEIDLLAAQDFAVEYAEPPDDGFCAYYAALFTVKAPENNYETVMKFLLEIGPNYIRPCIQGMGGGDDVKNYVVWIDTSGPEWSAEYPVYQRLPGNQVMCIPIFIVPTKSCAMSVRLEFETLEGEIIQGVPLKNANFVIPYYENSQEYIDGNLLDWDNIEGDVVTCLPFSSEEGKVNIAFPFVNSSTIVPPETIER